MSELTNALSKFYKQQSHESEMYFFKTFRESVEKKIPVAVPVIKNIGSLHCCVFEKRGQKHAIMFSDDSRISHRFGEDRIIRVDIPTLINALYFDPHLEGLSIDPDSPDSVELGKVNPNPLVGAVIVKDDKIIGEGYHTCYGELHAEREAIKAATENRFHVRALKCMLLLNLVVIQVSSRLVQML